MPTSVVPPGHGDGHVIDGRRSTEVKDALDLCLACKGCRTDCSANVDMATYKAEFLAHHYEGRPWLRPRSDFTMGWLPAIARVVGRLRAGRLVNALTHTPGLAHLATLAAGSRTARLPCSPGKRRDSGSHAAGPPVTGPAAPFCCGRTVSPTTSTRTSAGPRFA